MQQPSGTYPEVRLKARRRIPNRTVALGGVMFGVSLVVVVAKGGVLGWLSAVLFGLCLATFLIDRVRPMTMVIDRDCVELIDAFGRRRSFRFVSCGAFGVMEQTVATGRRIDWLTFDYDGVEPRTRLQRANLEMTGTNSQVRIDGFEHSPGDIAELLNSYRLAARSRSQRP